MIQEHVVHSDRRKSDLNTGATVTGALKYLLPYAKLAKKNFTCAHTEIYYVLMI